MVLNTIAMPVGMGKIFLTKLCLCASVSLCAIISHTDTEAQFDLRKFENVIFCGRLFFYCQ